MAKGRCVWSALDCGLFGHGAFLGLPSLHITVVVSLQSANSVKMSLLKHKQVITAGTLPQDFSLGRRLFGLR